MFGFETVARLHDIPLIRSSTDLVQTIYSKAKQTSVLIRYPCTVAETLVDQSLKIASPFIQPFSRPVHAIDEFAAGKLRDFERKFPVINTTPDDVFDSINGKAEPVFQAVHSVKDTATSKIQQGKETISNVADSVLSFCSTQKRSNCCQMGEVTNFVFSLIGSFVTSVCQSAQSNFIWLRMFIIYNLMKIKQTNDFILSRTRQIPFLNHFLQRVLISFGTTVECIAQRIRPDDRTLFDSKQRQTNKFFKSRPRFEPDPSLNTRPDVIGTDQHVFPERDSNDLHARLAARAIHVTATESSDIRELHERVQPTDIEQLHSRLDTDEFVEPLTDDQRDLLARLDADANDSD